jgi:DNA-binding response OmpR family regulator
LPATPVGSGKMNILIVEDEKNIANSLRLGFLDEGFTVDVCNDGDSAYDKASESDFDVIVLDVMLPGMNGIEVCKRLRADKNHTPIIMLTAKDSLEDKVLGLETGADDYVVKPFSFEELLARVRSLIRRSTTGETNIKVDTLELNPTTRIVCRSGKEIELTAKEYNLLEYLMSHANQILTRDQIINHVWDYNYESFNNPVDVFVLRLRKKIETAFPGEKKIIHTIRGLGYKIGA